MKRLVVTADDFGLSSGVVSGIVRAHEHGIVTTTSLMVNAPAAEAAFVEARRRPSLATGLHFVLTFGLPVGPAEPLARLLDATGRFRRNDSGVHGRARPDEVRDELRAQLRRFEERVGRPPTHLDGHHHVHLHPGILRVVIEEAGRLSIPVRSTDPAVRERLRLERIRTTDAFVDRFFGAGSVGEEKLVDILDSLADGVTELMCHPAAEDEELTSLSGYAEPRVAELGALISRTVRDAVARNGIELVPMSAV